MRIKEAGIERTNEILPNGEARAAGEVLQSNGNGTMSWQVMSSSGGNNEGGAGAGPWKNWCTDNVNEYQPIANFDAKNSDFFGETVSISGDYAIVGAFQDNEGLVAKGSATILKRNNGTGMWLAHTAISPFPKSPHSLKTIKANYFPKQN